MSFVCKNLATIQSSYTKRSRRDRRRDKNECTDERTTIRKVSVALDVLLNLNSYLNYRDSGSGNEQENKLLVTKFLSDDISYDLERLVYRASVLVLGCVLRDNDSRWSMNNDYNGKNWNLTNKIGQEQEVGSNDDELSCLVGNIDCLSLNSNFVAPEELIRGQERDSRSNYTTINEGEDRVRHLCKRLLKLRTNNKYNGSGTCDVIHFLSIMTRGLEVSGYQDHVGKFSTTSIPAKFTKTRYFENHTPFFKPSNFLHVQKLLHTMNSPRCIQSFTDSTFSPLSFDKHDDMIHGMKVDKI